MKMSLSTIYTIDPKNISLLSSVRNAIKRVNNDARQIIFKVFINNDLPSKNLNFSDESKLINENGIDLMATSPSEIFESLISKDHEVDALIKGGYMVFEVEGKNYNQEFIGFDYFLTLANLETFLGICMATPANDHKDKQGVWQGKDSENKTSRYGNRSSNRVFDINYYYLEMDAASAVDYLSTIIDDPSKTILPGKSNIRSSKLYVVSGQDIRIKIDKEDAICGYPYTLQRLFFIYHSIREWVKTLSNRWIEIYPNDFNNTFTYTIKRESWAREEEKNILFFKKKFTMSDTSLWSVFCVDDKIVDKSRLNVCVDFLKKYGINVMLDKFSGEIETDSATVSNYIIRQSGGKIFALPINQIKLPTANNVEAQEIADKTIELREEQQRKLNEAKKEELKKKKKENKEARKSIPSFPPPVYSEPEQTEPVVITMPKPKNYGRVRI